MLDIGATLDLTQEESLAKLVWQTVVVVLLMVVEMGTRLPDLGRSVMRRVGKA